MAAFLLTTPRLGLRPHQKDDVSFMISLNADPEVVRYTGDVAFSSPAEAEAVIASLEAQYAARRMGRFLVIERSTGAPVGWCGLRWFPEEAVVDLGYRFLRDRWGRGYATEAAQACVQYAFHDLELPSLIAHVMPENHASARVLLKLGARRVGPSRCQDLDADLYRLDNPRAHNRKSQE